MQSFNIIPRVHCEPDWTLNLWICMTLGRGGCRVAGVLATMCVTETAWSWNHFFKFIFFATNSFVNSMNCGNLTWRQKDLTKYIFGCNYRSKSVKFVHIFRILVDGQICSIHTFEDTPRSFHICGNSILFLHTSGLPLFP